MGRGRLEAFSDGVIAIIITIMVLELKAPHEASAHALAAQAPVFLSYALSFLVVAIMWVNHHHLLHAIRAVDAPLLWWNNALLFAMSLIPFSTAFLGENPRSPLAVGVYGSNLALAGFGFFLLRGAVARRADPAGLYASAVPLAYVSIWISFGIYLLIPALYFMPERKLETAS
ncbi:MAG: DUF1211 domain-containing protein [Deltaproteobacteria bacterium]|nr:MAG: DUF1211 domain-containing protein [Deltaproteobacteria bacterium]